MVLRPWKIAVVRQATACSVPVEVRTPPEDTFFNGATEYMVSSFSDTSPGVSSCSPISSSYSSRIEPIECIYIDRL